MGSSYFLALFILDATGDDDGARSRGKDMRGSAIPGLKAKLSWKRKPSSRIGQPLDTSPEENRG